MIATHPSEFWLHSSLLVSKFRVGSSEKASNLQIPTSYLNFHQGYCMKWPKWVHVGRKSCWLNARKTLSPRRLGFASHMALGILLSFYFYLCKGGDVLPSVCLSVSWNCKQKLTDGFALKFYQRLVLAQFRYHFGGDLHLNTAIFFKGFLAIGTHHGGRCGFGP